MAESHGSGTGRLVNKRFLDNHIKENPNADRGHIEASIAHERRQQIGPAAPEGKGADGKFFIGTPGTPTHRTFTTPELASHPDYKNILAHHQEQHGGDFMSAPVKLQREQNQRAQAVAPHREEFAAAIDDIVKYKTPMLAGETQEQATAREQKSWVNPLFGRVHVQARATAESGRGRNVSEHVPISQLKAYLASVPGEEVWVDHPRLDPVTNEVHAHSVTGVRPAIEGVGAGQQAFRGVGSLSPEKLQERAEAGLATTTVNRIARNDFHTPRMPRRPIASFGAAVGKSPSAVAEARTLQGTVNELAAATPVQISRAGWQASSLIGGQEGIAPEEAQAFAVPEEPLNRKERGKSVKKAGELIAKAKTGGLEPPKDVVFGEHDPVPKDVAEYEANVTKAVAGSPLGVGVAKATKFFAGAEAGTEPGYKEHPASFRPLVKAQGSLQNALRKVARVNHFSGIGTSRQVAQMLGVDQAVDVAAEQAGSIGEAMIASSSEKEVEGAPVIHSAGTEIEAPSEAEQAKLARFKSVDAGVARTRNSIRAGDQFTNTTPETRTGIRKLGLEEPATVYNIRDDPSYQAADYLHAIALHHATGDPRHLHTVAARYGAPITTPSVEDAHAELEGGKDRYDQLMSAAVGGDRIAKAHLDAAHEDAFTRKVHSHPVFSQLLGQPTHKMNAQNILAYANKHGIATGDGSFETIARSAQAYKASAVRASQQGRGFDPLLSNYTDDQLGLTQEPVTSSMDRGLLIGRGAEEGEVTPPDTAQANKILSGMAGAAIPGGAPMKHQVTDIEYDARAEAAKSQAEIEAVTPRRSRSSQEDETPEERADREEAEAEHRKYLRPQVSALTHLMTGLEDHSKWELTKPGESPTTRHGTGNQVDAAAMAEALNPESDVEEAAKTDEAEGYEPAKYSSKENPGGGMMSESIKKMVDEKADVERYNKMLDIYHGSVPTNEDELKTYNKVRANLEVGPRIRHAFTPEEVDAKKRHVTGMLLAQEGLIDIAEQYNPEEHGEWGIQPKEDAVSPTANPWPLSPEEKAGIAARQGELAEQTADYGWSRTDPGHAELRKLLYDPEYAAADYRAQQAALEAKRTAHLPTPPRSLDLKPASEQAAARLEMERIDAEAAAKAEAVPDKAPYLRAVEEFMSKKAIAQPAAADAAEAERQRLIAERQPAKPPMPQTTEEKEQYLRQQGVIGADEGELIATDESRAILGRASRQSRMPGGALAGGNQAASFRRGPLPEAEVEKRFSEHVAHLQEKARIEGLAPGAETLSPEDAAYQAAAQALAQATAPPAPPGAVRRPGGIGDITTELIASPAELSQYAPQAISGPPKYSLAPGSKPGDLDKVTVSKLKRVRNPKTGKKVVGRVSKKVSRPPQADAKPPLTALTQAEATRRALIQGYRGTGGQVVSPRAVAQTGAAIFDARAQREAVEAAAREAALAAIEPKVLAPDFSNPEGAGTGTTLGQRPNRKRGGQNRKNRKNRQRGQQ